MVEHSKEQKAFTPLYNMAAAYPLMAEYVEQDALPSTTRGENQNGRPNIG